MKIEKSILEKWGHLRSEDDTKKLADLTGKHPETIRKILRKGECSDEDFEVIAEFYDEKVDLMNRYL